MQQHIIFIHTHIEVYDNRREALEAQKSLKVTAESKTTVTTTSEMTASKTEGILYVHAQILCM